MTITAIGWPSPGLRWRHRLLAPAGGRHQRPGLGAARDTLRGNQREPHVAVPQRSEAMRWFGSELSSLGYSYSLGKNGERSYLDQASKRRCQDCEQKCQRKWWFHHQKWWFLEEFDFEASSLDRMEPGQNGSLTHTRKTRDLRWFHQPSRWIEDNSSSRNGCCHNEITQGGLLALDAIFDQHGSNVAGLVHTVTCKHQFEVISIKKSLQRIALKMKPKLFPSIFPHDSLEMSPHYAGAAKVERAVLELQSGCLEQTYLSLEPAQIPPLIGWYRGFH